jgi:hypothetical protein
MRIPKRSVVAILAIALAMVSTGIVSAATSGSWVAYPGQSTAYQSEIKAPIRADGSSVFNSKDSAKSVIPVKFGLLSGLGEFVFVSIYSNNPENTDDDYSFLSFTPSAPVPFDGLTDLIADYTFTTGNCHGGSLRWSVWVDRNSDGLDNDGRLFIYYGAYPNFTDCSSADSPLDTNQSGENMIGKPDLRYDTSQWAVGTFYNSYTNAKTLANNAPVRRASLVLDSGWGGDQALTLGSATVNGNTFTPPPATPLKATCDLPPAQIRVTKAPDVPGAELVQAPTSIQPADTNGWFRVVDCKYMYNLATSSLLGSGRYKVEVVINGEAVPGAAYFSLK